MTRDQVIASLQPGETAGYAVDALLHLLELASWELCNRLIVGEPATREVIDIVSSIDRTVELVRKQHAIELDAVAGATLEFVTGGV